MINIFPVSDILRTYFTSLRASKKEEYEEGGKHWPYNTR